MVRASFVDKHGLKKGAWSREEDEKLRAYVQRYGHWNWRELPKFAGLSRCGKSCRLRWMNYLRPNVKHGNYAKEEEELIIKLHEQLGNKWSMIAAKLPGRTDNEVKNYWNTRLKKRVIRNRHSSDESKEQSCETSVSEISHNNRESMEAESALDKHSTTPTRPIVESNPFSPDTSCAEFSYLSSDSALATGSAGTHNYWVAEDSAAFTSFQTLKECSEDFWTQPFAVDETYNQDGHDLSLQECIGDFWTQPFVADYTYNQDGHELFLQEGGYFDDSIDLFYQLMQELPEICSGF